MKKEMTPEEIRNWNSKVDYNNSAAGIIGDILCAVIFWPMLVTIIYRRCKYRNKIEQ